MPLTEGDGTEGQIGVQVPNRPKFLREIISDTVSASEGKHHRAGGPYKS
jgi:hypothetical protein